MTLPSRVRQAAVHADAWVRRLRASANGGVVPFRQGRFAKSQDRAAFAARNYYEGGQLAELTSRYLECDPPARQGRALDIGCGYGRLTPHLCDAPNILSVHGVEPNTAARERAASLYPFITFSQGTAAHIPYPDDYFHLVVAWTVLQHIPGGQIAESVREITRVTAPGGYLIICDKTTGESTAVIHPRPIWRYEDLLDGFELVDTRTRALEPTDNREGENTVMIFKSNGGDG